MIINNDYLYEFMMNGIYFNIKKKGGEKMGFNYFKLIPVLLAGGSEAMEALSKDSPRMTLLSD